VPSRIEMPEEGNFTDQYEDIYAPFVGKEYSAFRPMTGVTL